MPWRDGPRRSARERAYQISSSVTRKPASWFTQRNRRQPLVASAAVSSVTPRNGHDGAR